MDEGEEGGEVKWSQAVNMDRQVLAVARREKEKSSKNKLLSINHKPGWPCQRNARKILI